MLDNCNLNQPSQVLSTCQNDSSLWPITSLLMFMLISLLVCSKFRERQQLFRHDDPPGRLGQRRGGHPPEPSRRILQWTDAGDNTHSARGGQPSRQQQQEYQRCGGSPFLQSFLSAIGVVLTSMERSQL